MPRVMDVEADHRVACIGTPMTGLAGLISEVEMWFVRTAWSNNNCLSSNLAQLLL